MNHCDLYPVLPSLRVLMELKNRLPALLEAESVTALRLCFDTAIQENQLDMVRQMAWEHDVALILAPAAPELLQGIALARTDGVHFARTADVKAMARRKDRPATLQIGCNCLTLDDAMSAGERGADYVSLPATGLAALTQWSMIAELPAVAEDVTTAEEACAAAQAGADFLAVTLSPGGEAMDRFAAVRTALPA